MPHKQGFPPQCRTTAIKGDDIEGTLSVRGQQTVFDENKESYYDIYIDETHLTESEARDWLDNQRK